MGCKNHITGIVTDRELYGYNFVYGNDMVEPDAKFNYCPRCGAKLNERDDTENHQKA